MNTKDNLQAITYLDDAITNHVDMQCSLFDAILTHIRGLIDIATTEQSAIINIGTAPGELYYYTDGGTLYRNSEDVDNGEPRMLQRLLHERKRIEQAVYWILLRRRDEEFNRTVGIMLQMPKELLTNVPGALTYMHDYKQGKGGIKQ